MTPPRIAAVLLLPLAAVCVARAEPASPAAAMAAPAACSADASHSLLAVHRRARAAHLAGDANALAADSADTVISAQHGRLTSSTREEIRARFTRYFGQVEYRRWDDLDPPTVRVSADGTQGWMAVRIVGELRRRETEGVTVGEAHGAGNWEQFHSSWVATYARTGCDWKMTAIASEVVQIEAG